MTTDEILDLCERLLDLYEDQIGKPLNTECLIAASAALRTIAKERDELERHVELLQEKDSFQTCACSYDYPDDVCMAHAPLLKRAEADRDRLSARAGELEKRLEEAETVLSPFIESAQHRVADATEWRNMDSISIVVTIGELRAARDFLANKEKTDG